MMPYPKSENKVHNLILKTAELEAQIGTLLLKIDENKKKIQKHFDESDTKVIKIPVCETNGKRVNVVCKKSERVTVKYDVEKLKEKLDDELFLEVTNRTYTIKDINAMIKLVRDAGVKGKDFKALIEANVTPNTQAIKMLYNAGELNMKMLKGTYTATISKNIKISEETGDND